MQDLTPGRHSGEPDAPAPLIPVERQALATRDAYGVPGYPQEHYEEGDDLGQTLRYYIGLVLKHKRLILGAALLALTIGGLFTLMKTPLYTATVRIQIDREAVKVLESGATTSGEANAYDYLNTQYELLQSLAMAERVAASLSLEKDDSFFEPRGQSLTGLVRSALFPAPEGPEPTEEERQKWAAGIVAGNVSVSPVPQSRLVDISYKDPNPARAQRIANAYSAAYMDSNVDKRFQANKFAKTFLEDQIKQLKLRLEDSEKPLLEFAEREKIIATNEKASNAENNLSAANVALGQLVGKRIQAEQVWEQVSNASSLSLPQFLTNSVIDTLRAQRKTLMKEYEEKLETFKPGYPAMRQITNQVKAIDRQLAEEVKTIRASLKAGYENALSQENEMRERIDELQQEVLALQKKQVRYNILKREVDTNRKLYQDLLQRFKEVDIAGGVGATNVFVVDRARTPVSPSEPRLMRALLLSLMLGLGAGVGLAYLIEILDDRIFAPDDIEQVTGLTTIGVIPKITDERMVHEVLQDPHSAVAEAYRTLATALQFSTQTGLPRCLTVTSAGPGEGKSSTAYAIARHFATIGLKVLLIDADLRKPALHTRIGTDNATGLSNVLTGQAQPPEVIRATDIANLAFMPSGPLPPNAADLLSGSQLYSLISVGQEVFDLMIIDGPPTMGLADAQLLGNAASASLFVVGSGDQRKGPLRAAVRRLAMARVPLVGTVLTKFDAKKSSYGYGYGYGYGHEDYNYGHGVSNETAEPEKRLEAS